jgi:hypothetical protein
MKDNRDIASARKTNESVVPNTKIALRRQPFGFGPLCTNSLSIGYLLLWGVFFFGVTNEFYFFSLLVVDILIKDAFQRGGMGTIFLQYFITIPPILFQIFVWIIVLARVRNLQKPVPTLSRKRNQPRGDNNE